MFVVALGILMTGTLCIGWLVGRGRGFAYPVEDILAAVGFLALGGLFIWSIVHFIYHF